MGKLEYVPLSRNIELLLLYHSYALLWNTVKAAELDIAVSVGHSLNILTEHIIYLKENPETHHMICITQPRAS